MALHSKWSSGHLIFYDGTDDIFEIKNGTDGVEFHQAVTYPDPEDQTTTGGAGTITLTATSNRIQFVDTSGDAITMELPGSTSNPGLEFKIFKSTSSGVLTVVDAVTTGTIVTIGASEGAICVCNGTVWRGIVGGVS
jgi:hypothetical protein